MDIETEVSAALVTGLEEIGELQRKLEGDNWKEGFGEYLARRKFGLRHELRDEGEEL